MTLEGDEHAGRFGSDASLASASQRSLPKLIVVIKTKETATHLITFTSKPCASDTTDPLPVSSPHGGRRGGCPHRRLPSSSPGTRLRQSLNLQSSKLSLFSFAGELTETAAGSLGGRGVPGTVEELTGQATWRTRGHPGPDYLPAAMAGSRRPPGGRGRRGRTLHRISQDTTQPPPRREDEQQVDAAEQESVPFTASDQVGPARYQRKRKRTPDPRETTESLTPPEEPNHLNRRTRI